MPVTVTWVFFSTAISVYSGVDAVPRNLIRMAQSFNVPFHAIVRRVIWPGAPAFVLKLASLSTGVAEAELSGCCFDDVLAVAAAALKLNFIDSAGVRGFFAALAGAASQTAPQLA